jgi:hypothetical protein
LWISRVPHVGFVVDLVGYFIDVTHTSIYLR